MAGERKSDDNSRPQDGAGSLLSWQPPDSWTPSKSAGAARASSIAATKQSLGRSVAIKVLASDLDEDDRERFLREGYAMGGLSGHPNIVNILQVGVTESNRPYIVMPYHAAGSLAERVRREGRIAWPDALRIGVKLCGALETAHRTGTLHRDIKPANVLVNDYGEPQLSDFGTARIAGGYKTVTGFFTGTLSYTAPEVLAGNPPTVAADVYSLGATIYALIAGIAAHERKTDEDLIAHYLRITSTPVPDLRPEGIPADVCAAIEKAMSLEPAEPARVGGGIRPRTAVGAAAQRVDTGSDGAQRAGCRVSESRRAADADATVGSRSGQHRHRPYRAFDAPAVRPTGGPPPPAGTPAPMFAAAPTSVTPCPCEPPVGRRSRPALRPDGPHTEDVESQEDADRRRGRPSLRCCW